MDLKFKKKDSPYCLCHYNNETSMHSVLDCFLYTIGRQQLYDQVSQVVPEFNQMSKTIKLEILLFGFPDNDCFDLNIKLVKTVQ